MDLDHLAKCSARPITTADILFDDVVKDLLPKDEQCRQDFGFSRCLHWRGETHLLGLYRGLILFIQDREINQVNLNKWQREGLLAKKIIEKFSTIPENSRGSYFPWFLRNQYVLGDSMPFLQLSIEANPLLEALDAAKRYLDPEDRDHDFCDLEPFEKRYCFVFYSLALDSSVPDPNWLKVDIWFKDLWYDFGFAICTNEYHERCLGALYSRLVGGNKPFRDYEESLEGMSPRAADSLTCPFDDFWRARKDGKMAELFDKYGMGDRLDGNTGSGFTYELGFSHLRGFMSYAVRKHGLRPSIWRLKHILALEDNTPWIGFSEIKVAAEEYGFLPQLDARTKMELLWFYRRLLQVGDPLEVHKAKQHGKLLEYAQSSVGHINNRVHEVLQTMDSRRDDT